jgi:hypothetical protein
VKPDPIDQLGARLFESARNEALPEGAEQRALEAIERENRRQGPARVLFPGRRKWLAAAAAIAIAAAFGLLMRPKETSSGISAEPTRARPKPEPRSVVPRVEASSQPAPALTAPPVAPKLPASVRPTAPVHSAPASLSDELSALKVASGALSSGDAPAALAALDRYDRVLKGQKLRAEATLLRIEALSRTGQAGAASALAQRFVEQNPGNPLVDRARSFVHE